VLNIYKILFISFIFILSNCDRGQLDKVTAQDILDTAALEKGKRAVLVNVWATW
jgi:hypothetical protein